MTLTELRKKFHANYKTILNERAMRDRVFKEGDPKRAAKLREMDELLAFMVELKDLAKPHCEPEIEQATLLDVPGKNGYQ